MNKMAFGQFYNSNSLIHKIDSRIKIIFTILFMISIFLVPTNNFILMGSLFVFTFFIVLLTKVPLNKYLKSLKQIVFLLVFAFSFQMFFRNEGTVIFSYNLNFTWINITISIILLILYILFNKYLPLKLLILVLLAILIIYILGIPMNANVINNNPVVIRIYKEGIISGSFIILRVLTLIIFTTILTLTTKPTDLNNGIESLLSPLELLHIKTSIFAMMISIALRFIPTLFLEADKILKAQASRGVDFNEGSLREKIKQIISLLVPMFIVSFKRADELAVAMEARGYVPGEKRTKINLMKLKFSDILWLILFIIVLVGLIILRVLI
ncbi:MAG: energy-coupling factor transporter transmembrane protein EcfT [Bacilli bacterium]|nr:energy-coupling factor transporter transmembrane protein EcfT [Bacilli bacterium]